jgi:hypothetical protein
MLAQGTALLAALRKGRGSSSPCDRGGCLAGVVRHGVCVALDRARHAAAAAGLHCPAHRAAQPRRHLRRGDLGLGFLDLDRVPHTPTRRGRTNHWNGQRSRERRRGRGGGFGCCVGPAKVYSPNFVQTLHSHFPLTMTK